MSVIGYMVLTLESCNKVLHIQNLNVVKKKKKEAIPKDRKNYKHLLLTATQKEYFLTHWCCELKHCFENHLPGDIY